MDSPLGNQFQQKRYHWYHPVFRIGRLGDAVSGMAVEMHLDAETGLIIRGDINVWSSPA
jgi:hypothetical protein